VHHRHFLANVLGLDRFAEIGLTCAHRALADRELLLRSCDPRFLIRIELTLPANPNLAPPGWYMVFAVSTGGVPSMAQWLYLQSQ